ncbi:DNA helicase PcrA [Parageobacillus thermoglucosidasius]|uniref:ATP-dependent DNA helicase n=3 Tax=Anoxybacillaceae TaxID=3120669 RepID=A0AAN0YMJ5_PARTM|nr:DNA helicase PcrA [Parageobacillus thermoglucosidasius]AEH49468.1 ATP-dependent DNA helicase PcrA [Parageobacillus thermoglucosidasius C56-YS93]ALF09383.1 ATP-dependent DNA helicase PcrA [Parageobacillus thermoglucosidasius]ANZ29466.1 ATP-dependent DNA helicase PcrA [Parageobacillus thermoglucosidasius]APM80204.1 ATP-dependent DNA helicase PcrA [Parageobacillus thermoglucosidasius]KJX70253.1 ATP-dependent DNA helicase PcrA [Parageobacillus thermoglucosidasius]
MNFLSEKLLANLNEQQQAAVKTTEGPLLIMAGAGSGKTRVLTHRIAYLLAEKQVAPWNILAITFTNKAAREMKERVQALLGGAAEEIWISTFHSMCVRILRRDIDRIGIDRNFSILDTTDQLSVLKNILKEKNIDPKKFDPRSILGTISSAKNELLSPEKFAKKAGNYYEKIVSDVYEEYQKRLLRNHALDFDDLIMTTIQLFERVPEVLEHYQYKFQYIHIDEYQDTNRAQYMLVKMLASRFQNICVVGDADQSIYRWRGADIQNILSFEKDYPNAKVILLEQNYRSTKRILQAANEVIENNVNRKPKKLWTENPEGQKIVYYEAMNEADEAQFVAGKIKEYVESGKRRYSDFAVLYRTNAQSRVMEEVLLKSNIPYQIVGGLKFYDRKEIKDILAYLRVIANPNDDISLLRIINVPKRGIGASTLDKIVNYASENELSVFEALGELEHIGLSARIAASLLEFRRMLEQWGQLQEYVSVTELVEEVLDKSGYREMLKAENTLEAQSRLENIDEFLSVTKHFENVSEDKSLIAFLTDLALISDIDQLNDADGEDGDAVVLMTLHSAKGLEFPVVFLIGMEEGIFPHSRSLEDEDEMEEERRLAYVGITRAEEELFLTSAQMRTLFGYTNMNAVSRFIHEIPEELVERVNKRTAWAPAGKQTAFRKMAVASSTDGETVPWKVGDKVEHKKWGIGTVVSVRGEGEDKELDIAFPSPVGIKRLLAKFAPITKV